MTKIEIMIMRNLRNHAKHNINENPTAAYNSFIKAYDLYLQDQKNVSREIESHVFWVQGNYTITSSYL